MQKKSYNRLLEEIPSIFELQLTEQLIDDYEEYLRNWEPICDCGEENCEDCQIEKPEHVDVGQLDAESIINTMDRHTKNIHWSWSDFQECNESFYDYLGIDVDSFIDDIWAQIIKVPEYIATNRDNQIDEILKD